MEKTEQRFFRWFFSSKGGPVALFVLIIGLAEVFHLLFVFLLAERMEGNRRHFLVFGSLDILLVGCILIPPAIFLLKRFFHLEEITRHLRSEIEERIKTEGALREKERLLQLITENSRDILWIVDLDLNITYISRAAEKLLGYPLEEFKTKPFHEYFTPESLKEVMTILAEELAAEEDPQKDPYRTRVIETEQIHKDGSHRWVEIKATFLRDDAGKAVGLLGFSQDITEHKKTREALRKSEEQLRLIFENIREVVFVLDADLNITAMSPSVRQHLGYAPEELIGQAVRERSLISDDDLERALNQLKRTFEGEALSAEYEIRAKDGTTRYAEIDSSPIVRDGRIIGVIAVARNITDRKIAEKSAKESEEKYAALINNIPDIVYSLDAEGRIVTVNAGSLIPYGYTADDLIGRFFQDFIFPQDREWVLQAREDALGQNQEYRQGLRFRIPDKAGNPRWFELNSRRRYDAQGRYVGEEGVLRDITAALEAEEEKARLEEKLIQIQKLEAIGTLAGGIAHDFNNLLMGIQGHLSLLLLEIQENHPYYPTLKAMEQQVRSGAALTSQLLGFARGGRYRMTALDLNEWVRRTAEMFGRTKKEIVIHYQLDPDIRPVPADPYQMEQVLMNLFVNAAQAMPGGGELYLSTRMVFLDHTYTQAYALEPGMYVKLSVTDTGTGMDEKTKARIFEPFFTTKEMGRGTGLGLAMVYGIIKGHKGIINVYSEKGFGTTFNIYLPVVEGISEQKEEAEAEVLSGQGTILLVDDEETILEVTAKLLERLGYVVLTARRGEEAVEICRSFPGKIDLLILDMVLPGMNGAEIYERIKTLDPGIRVILSSGYSLNGQAATLLRQGCQGFIQKPYNLQELSQAVRKALEN